MISFSLTCESAHVFDAWFRSSDDFEQQCERSLVTCPHCNSSKISKALMAPSVSTGRRKEKLAMAADAEGKKKMNELREMARKVLDGSENVGDKFAEEARKIHFGESEARSIYGEASIEEAKSLIEDEIPFLPIPVLPDDRN